MNKTKTILITNDDSIYSPGIRALIEAAAPLAKKVVVVAPNKPCSGMGHAVTIGSPLRISPYNEFKQSNVNAYSTTGTPADCVKLAVNVILENQKPDLCLSGINHGINHSINILYSGTMSAAVEASLENIPSIGFSLDDLSIDADFEASKYYATTIIKKIINLEKSDYFCLNVNIPKGRLEDVAGIQLCKQAYGRYEESFEKRYDPSKKPYYWMKGIFLDTDNHKGGDIYALKHNFVSVVPIQFDMTNYTLMNSLKTLW